MIRTITLRLGLLFLPVVFLWTCASSDLSSPPKGYSNNTTLKLAYVTGALKLIDPAPAVPQDLVVYRDLVYKETAEKTLKLDIYRHQNLRGPTPLLIFIHGGSWSKGDKDDYRRYLVDYAEKGYVTATVAYRFAQEAAFPAALDDVVCAVKWLKSHAGEYHIDPDRIAVVGGSAGGHLAMLLAYHASDSSYVSLSDCVSRGDTRIKAVVNLYGPTDLTTEYAHTHPSVIRFIGSEYSDSTREAYLTASPLHFVTPDDPPTLIFHGTLDDLVPVSQADTLSILLRQNNVPTFYHRLKGWPHTMDLSRRVNQYCQYQMDAFFEEYLRMEE